MNLPLPRAEGGFSGRGVYLPQQQYGFGEGIPAAAADGASCLSVFLSGSALVISILLLSSDASLVISCFSCLF